MQSCTHRHTAYTQTHRKNIGVRYDLVDDAIWAMSEYNELHANVKCGCLPYNWLKKHCLVYEYVGYRFGIECINAAESATVILNAVTVLRLPAPLPPPSASTNDNQQRQPTEKKKSSNKTFRKSLIKNFYFFLWRFSLFGFSRAIISSFHTHHH